MGSQSYNLVTNALIFALNGLIWCEGLFNGTHTIAENKVFKNLEQEVILSKLANKSQR